MSVFDNLNYFGDSRVRAGERRKDSPIQSVDTGKMLATVTYVSSEEDGDAEVTCELPVKFEVCPTCHGRGKHVNPSIDAGGLSREDFDEDPDFREDYMSGVYDVTCFECRGQRVVPVLDRERIDAKVLSAIDEHERDLAAYRAEVAAERRMGA